MRFYLAVKPVPGNAAKLFTRLANENISVDMIIQSYARTASKTNDIAFTVDKADFEKAMEILERTGIASDPGRAFYHDDSGKNMVRFCYSKPLDVLEEAAEKIRKLR